MGIPKKIYQTWRNKPIQIPVIHEYIDKMLNMNHGYEYELFDDNDMDNFVNDNFDSEITECYNRLNIRTAKADFWRYLILYKNGGIYLDIDSIFLRPLDELIRDTDDAIITREPVGPVYVQWALMFCKNHPILEKTIQNVVFNIKNNISNNIIRMTGPYPYTLGVDQICNLCGYNSQLERENLSLWTNNSNIEQKPDKTYTYNNYNFRIYGVEYGSFALSWIPEKDCLYSNEHPHHSVEDQYKNLLK